MLFLKNSTNTQQSHSKERKVERRAT